MAKAQDRKKASKLLQEIITKIGMLSNIMTKEANNHGLKGKLSLCQKNLSLMYENLDTEIINYLKFLVNIYKYLYYRVIHIPRGQPRGEGG